MVFVLFVFIEGSHRFRVICTCRGSCRFCVICICKGAHVAFVLFVFVLGLMSHLSYFVFIMGLLSHLCYLYL